MTLLAAFTPTTSDKFHPPFINISLEEDGRVRVGVRSAASGGIDTTSSMYANIFMDIDEFRALAEEALEKLP